MTQSSRQTFENYLKTLLNEVFTDGVDEILELHTTPELDKIISLESEPSTAFGRFLHRHIRGDRTFSFEINFSNWSIEIMNLTGYVLWLCPTDTLRYRHAS